MFPLNMKGHEFSQQLQKFKISLQVENEDKDQNAIWAYIEQTAKQLEDIRIALDHSMIVAITDARGKIVYVNNQFCIISKYAREELLGKDHRILNSGYHSKSFMKELWTTIKSGTVWQGEIKNRAKDGTYYWVNTTIIPFLDEDGVPYQYIAFRLDITELKEAQEKIEHMAYHDPLTDLPNRRMFYKRLECELEKAKINNKKFATLFIDMDHFKHINDSLGHTFGDLFLKKVTKRLQRYLKDNKKNLFRLGGDEFIILLTNVENNKEVKRIADELLALFNQSFLIDGYEYFVSLSIGISIYPDHGTDIETLVKNADTAMYWSKNRGGNTFRFYRSAMNADYSNLVSLETKLRKAIEMDELQLHYQPQYDLASGRITGVEALCRWHDPELGMIPPDQFIPLAEERGIIYAIGEWSIASACKANKEWQEMGYPPIVVAVNISANHFQQEDFVEMVSQILLDTGLEPHYLELEITEASMMRHTELLLSTLERLKSMGVHISIDDFGTGYSSLGYLKKYSIDCLKIDRSFIQEISTNADSAKLVMSMINLAHNLDLKVIAEGVETEEQERFLKAHECDGVQGFYYSKPLPKQELQELLENERKACQ